MVVMHSMTYVATWLRGSTVEALSTMVVSRLENVAMKVGRRLQAVTERDSLGLLKKSLAAVVLLDECH
jgi:hypothetical protein